MQRGGGLSAVASTPPNNRNEPVVQQYQAALYSDGAYSVLRLLTLRSVRVFLGLGESVRRGAVCSRDGGEGAVGSRLTCGSMERSGDGGGRPPARYRSGRRIRQRA